MSIALHYLVDLVYYFYDKACMYVKSSVPSKYNSFIDLNKICQEDDFVKGYEDDKIKSTVELLNSAPQIVHNILFEQCPEVCSKFYQVYFKLNDKDEYVQQYHNLSSLPDMLDDSSFRFIFIRTNLVKSSDSSHVNSIIIDKERNSIIYFEPMFDLRLSLNSIHSVLTEHWGVECDEIERYKLLTAPDLGYNCSNKLQRFDSFCQTYVLYTFCLVVANPTVLPEEYKTMFNDIIKRKDSIRAFLYNVYTHTHIDTGTNKQFVGTTDEINVITTDTDGFVEIDLS